MNTAILLAITAACALSDVLTGLIPNSLILSGLFCGLASRIPGTFSAHGFADAAAGFLFPYMLLGLPVLLHMLGGGDVKLFSVIGLWLGRKDCLLVMWASLLAGAVFSLRIVWRQKNLGERLGVFALYAQRVKREGRLLSYPEGAGGTEGRFPFAAAIFPAVVVVLAKRGGV